MGAGPMWFELAGRGHIRATGEDRARLLHAMSTNHVQQLTTGQGVYAFFLNAQGRIQADAHILALEDALLIDVAPEVREKIFAHLDRYIIADDVTLEDQSEAWTTIAVEGEGAAEVLHEVGAPLPEAANSWLAWGARMVVQASYTGALGYWIFAPVGAERDATVAAVAAAGATPANAEQVEVARLTNGRPKYGVDFTESTIPHETQLLHALHFNKGCYLGQEIVERVRSRGHVNKLLSRIAVEGSEPPGKGSKVLAGEKEAGEITSAAFSPDQGRVMALAVMRAEFLRGGAPLTVDGRAVELLGAPV